MVSLQALTSRSRRLWEQISWKQLALWVFWMSPHVTYGLAPQRATSVPLEKSQEGFPGLSHLLGLVAIMLGSQVYKDSVC